MSGKDLPDANLLLVQCGLELSMVLFMRTRVRFTLLFEQIINNEPEQQGKKQSTANAVS